MQLKPRLTPNGIFRGNVPQTLDRTTGRCVDRVPRKTQVAKVSATRPIPKPPKQKSTLDHFIDAFGETQGCVLFAHGKNLNKCLIEKIFQQRKTIDNLTAENARLEKSNAGIRRTILMRSQSRMKA